MTEHLESALAQLPEPLAPADLPRIVMARVAQVAEERPPACIASRAPAPRARAAQAGSWTDLPAWVAVVAGLAIVFVSWVDGELTVASVRDLLASRVAANTGTPEASSYALLALLAGLLLYLAGVFQPLRRNNRSSS